MNGKRLRILVAGLSLGLLGLSSACGAADGSTGDVGTALNGEKGGDTSPGELVQVGEGDSGPTESEPPPTEQAMPDGPDKKSEDSEDDDEDDVRLESMEKPSEAFPDPKLPKKPAEDSDELTHIVYLLESSAWTAAGVVDDDTETDCSIDSSKLTQEGSYDFDCSVSFSGATVDYSVTAKVKDKQVPVTLDTKKLPVSEEKAVHEATRQAFEPARVTCDVVGVEAIRVGKKDGFTCWVTDVENERTTYLGEVLDDGKIVLREE